MEKVTICTGWGGEYYTADYVNRLYHSCVRNMSRPFDFVLLAGPDVSGGTLDSNIKIIDTGLPPRPRTGAAAVLTPLQRRLVVAAIVAAHALAAWGLMQVRAVRDAVTEAAPILVSLLATPAPPAPPLPAKRRPSAGKRSVSSVTPEMRKGTTIVPARPYAASIRAPVHLMDRGAKSLRCKAIAPS